VREDLFDELSPELEALAEALFDVSVVFVRKSGGFLPHGAVLEADGGVQRIAACSGDPDAITTPAAELPFLHQSLRDVARDPGIVAIAVCEDVTITLEGEKPTPAVKVLVEHRRALSVAYCLPWRKKWFGRIALGGVITMDAAPEVRPWDGPTSQSADPNT
jgi:hypothetical protein